MKKSSFIRFCRSMLAIVLALMLPVKSFAAALGQPNLLTAIEAQAFMNDDSIKEVFFPDSLKTISSQAFSGCSALTKAIIPETVEEIAADAFEGLQGQLTIETVKGCYAWNWAKENGFQVYDPNIAFDVEFEHYFSTLYLDGNMPEVDVAYIEVSGELEDDEAIEWKLENISGQECMNGYLYINEDGQSAYVMAESIAALGESVWRASAVLPNGEEWSQEFSIKVENLPENIPNELEVDYPFRGEVGKRFEFKPSERIRNLDAFPDNGNQKLCGISYYSEIWDDPTHELVDDGENGAFAFTPAKSGRYGISLYYYIGNHVIEHHGIIIIGDGTTDENKLVTRLPETVYANAATDTWLGNITVERYHLLPGEEVIWSVKRLGNADETPVAKVAITDLFDDTKGANFTLTDVTGETGTVTYRITASVGGSVFNYDYVLNVAEPPVDLPTEITVPQTEYHVAVGDTLNLLTEDICFADGNVPEGAYVFQDYWDLHYLEEEQEVEWLEDGISVHFVQDGRYQITAVKFLAGIEYYLPITIIAGSGVAQNIEIHELRFFEKQYVNMDQTNYVGELEVRDYQLLEGEELTWNIQPVGEDDGRTGRVFVDGVWEDGLCAELYMDQFSGETGVTNWRLTVTSSMGGSWTKDYQIETVEKPEDLPTEILVPEEIIYLEAGETYRVSRDDIRLGGNVPENAKVWFDLKPDELSDLPGFEWKDNGFEVPLTENGRYTYYIGAIFNGVEGLVKRITVVVGDGSLPASEVDQYFTTLYVGGNQDTVDVAWLGIPWEELEENDEIWWELQKVSGDDDLELYTEDISNDVQCAFVVYATNIVTEGESVWKATATLHDGMVLEHELNFRTIPLPENIPELDVDYPFCGETGERFEFKPSERIRNLDAFPQDGNENYCRVAYYAEIWNDPTHENVDDYPHGAFAFTPAKSDRYGISLYYCMGNHVIEHHGIIFIGDGTSDENHLEIRLPNMIYTDASTDSWLGNVMVDRYPLLPGEEVDWNIELLESTTETPAATVVRTDLFEETMGANFTLSHLSGEPGTVTYRITASVGGSVFTYDYVLEVLETPENIPTGITVPETEYRVEVGDELTFLYEDIQFADGNVPEGAYEDREYLDVWHLEEEQQVEWSDEGISVHFVQDGRYQITAFKLLGGIEYYLPITIIAGSGVPQNVEIHEQMDIIFDTQYINHGNVNWIGDFELRDYQLMEGEELTWKIEQIDETGINPGVIKVDHVWDDGLCSGVHMYDFTGETGVTTWRLTVASSMGYSWSKEYQIETLEMPEELPTEIIEPEEIIYLEAGETYRVSRDDIRLGGNVPENAKVWFDLMPDELGDLPGFEWKDNGFEVPLTEDGRYIHHIGAVYNGVEGLVKRITVIVGDGISENAHMSCFMPSEAYYINSDQNPWLADAYVENYTLLEDEKVEWDIECLSGEGSVELYQDFTWDDDLGSCFCLRNFTGATGEVTYRITARIGDFVQTCEGSFRVEEMPDNLPGGIWLENEEIHLDIGERLSVRKSDIFFTEDGVVPEGASIFKDLYTDQFNWHEDFEWVDDGFDVVFHEDGRYMFEAVASINGVDYAKQIPVIVGSGIPADAWVEYNGTERTVYANTDTYIWAFSAYVQNYNRMQDEEFNWTLEQVSEGEPVAVVERGDDEDWMGIHYNVCPTGEATGTVEYCLTLETSGGFASSQNFIINVVEKPENFPTDIVVPQTEYHLEVGETFTFTDEGIEPADGELTENDWFSINFIGLENGIEQQEDFRWLPDDVNGFEVSFHENGRYGFEVHYWINNILYVKTVTIVVGTGIPENAGLAADQQLHTAYLGAAHDCYAGNVHLEGFRLIPGEHYEWSIEVISQPEGELPVELMLGDEQDDGNAIDIHAAGINKCTGTVTYRVYLRCEGDLEFWTDLTIDVVDLPENLPTMLQVPATEYYLQPGDVIEVFIDQIEFADGEVPEGADVCTEFWGMENLPDMEWIENGIRARFDRDGRYQFTLARKIGNYEVTQQVLVVVGSGIPEDAELHIDQQLHTAYLGGDQGSYAGNAWIEGFRLLQDEYYEWSLELVEPIEGKLPVEVELYDENDDGNGIAFGVCNIGEGTGQVTYRLTLRCEGGLEFSKEITVEVVELPENMPAVIEVPHTHYEIAAGETLELLFEDICIADGEVPEGVEARKTYHIDEGQFSGTEWMEDRVSILCENDGRYEIIAAVEFGNYIIRQPIVVTVGSGIPADAWVEYWGTERTVYSNSDACIWAFDAYVHNYNRLEDDEFNWTLEQVSEGEPAVHVERVEAGDNWLGVWYDLLPTGEATGTVIYRLTLETGSGFTASQDFTIHVIDLPENFPTDISVPQTEYHLEVGETFTFIDEGIEPVDGEVAENDWISISFQGLERGIEHQESFHWLEDVNGFEVTFHENGRYFFEVHCWINNILYAKPIEVIVGSGIPQDAGIVENAFFENQYVNMDGVNWVADLRVVNYQLVDGESLEWTIKRIDQNAVNPGRVEIDVIWNEGLDAGLHLYDFTGETGSTKWLVEARSSMGHSWSREYDIDFIEMPENLPMEIAWPENVIHLEVGETYYALYEDVRLAEGNLPEDAEVRIDLYPYELDGYHTFAWTDNGFEVTFEEDGRYVYAVGAAMNGIEIGKDVVLSVGSGVAEDIHLAMTLPFSTHYMNDQVQWMADAYLENFVLAEGEEVQWTIECLDENPVANLFVDPTWDNGLGAGFRMNDFTGVPGTVNYRITAWLNEEPIRVYEDSVLVEEMPGDLPDGVAIEQETVYLQPGEMYSVCADDIFFTDDGAVPEDAQIYKEFHAEAAENCEYFEWNERGGFDVVFHSDGRYVFHAVAYLNGIEYAKEICVIIGNGESSEAWLNVWHAQDTVYVGGDDTWNGNAYVENFVLFEGETVEWSFEPQNPEEELIAELYIDEDGCWDEGLGVNYNVRNAVSAGEIAYVLTAKLPNGQVMQEKLLLYVQEMPENMPTELTVPQDNFVVKCGESIILWPDEFNVSNGEVPENAATMYDVFFDDTIQYFEWIMEDDREGILIQFDQPGDTVVHAVKWIGNICLMKAINVSVVDTYNENVIELWVAEGVRGFTEQKVQAFKDSDENYADLTLLVRSISEADAADAVFADTDNSGDIFVFAQDQLARLVSASKLETVNEENTAVIASQNDEGSVNAVKIGDVTYAYPMTSDNGYFLFYDRNIISDPSRLEDVIAACEEAGAILGIEITSGWYQPAFFFGAGCKLEYGYDEHGNMTSCDVDYASENGVRALKAMMMLAHSSAFVNASDCNGLENIGALVSGVWNANLMQQKLGDGYAAVKLPTVDGFQMSGFGGYKMLGIKPQTSEAKKAVCEALAMYLTSAQVQAERYEAVQWGPSNLQVQQSAAVQNNIALSALADQLQYCVPQGQYPDEYWNLAEKLGVRLLAGEFDDMDDAALLSVLTEFQNQAAALAQ